VDRYSVYVPKLLPKKENFFSRFRSCQGCGQALAVRLIGKAMESHGLYPFGSGDMRTDAASLPYDQWGLPGAPKKKQSLEANRVSTGEVVAMVGDPGTFAQGLKALADAASKQQRFLYICLFVESGIERSGKNIKTGYYPSATKSFEARIEHLQTLVKQVKNLGLRYMATVCPSYPFDLIKKVKAAMDCQGPSFLMVFAPCPTGCLYDPSSSLQAGRMAVATGFFPLYQIAEGTCQMTVSVSKMPPVSEYLKIQRSFSDLGAEDITLIEATVKRYYAELLQECSC
jgi:pyruvate ferredoxin oxidoreductase beta subunit